MLFVGNLFLLILLIVLGALSSLLILRKIENQKLRHDVLKTASLTSALYIGNPILITSIAFVCMYAYIAMANEKFSLYESYEYVRGLFLDKLWMQGKLIPVYIYLLLSTAIVYIITVVYNRINKDLGTEEDIEDIEDIEDEEDGVIPKTPSSSTGNFSKYYLLLLFIVSIYTIAITTLPLWETNKIQLISATSLMLSILIGMIIVFKHIFFSPILVALAIVACITMQP